MANRKSGGSAGRIRAYENKTAQQIRRTVDNLVGGGMEVAMAERLEVERLDDSDVREKTGNKREEVADRLVEFAARIVRLVSSLPPTTEGRHVGRQLLKCGTSPGAQYEEAGAAESKADFVHKLQIGLKEMRETVFWLRVTAKAGLISPNLLTAIIDEAKQLRAILSKSVATAKGVSR